MKLRLATLALLMLPLACGGRTVDTSEQGDDELGEGDSNDDDASDPLSCEGPDAPSGPIELVAGAMQPGPFVRVGERVYWADAWDEGADEAPSITLYRSDAATGDSWIPVALDQPGIHEIRSDGEAVYWVTHGAAQSSGALVRASLDDEITILDQGLLKPRALSFDAAHHPAAIEVQDAVAWVFGLTGLHRIVVGEPPDFVAGHGGPYELAVDSNHVYFASWNVFEDTALGEVIRVALSEGEADAEWVTSEGPRPTAVRVDDDAVYWATADEASGAIWMLCKSAI
ncbi:hypothetical protein ACNOYE_17715 [Nannocystaceae bacterium ST9]